MKKILNKYTRQEVFALATDAYRGVSTIEKYTPEQRKEGMNDLLKELSQDYRRNEIEIFEIMETVINEELPKRITETVGRFAEVRNFAEGDTVKFIVKDGKIKAFTVALGGTVRRQRINKHTITIETEAIQAKVYEEFARVKAGLVDFAELINDCLDAIEEEIYKSIYLALKNAYAEMPSANKHEDTSVVEKELIKLINVVKAYGQPVIYGTFLGVSEIPFDDSDASKNDKRTKGYVGMYKGCPIVALENSFEDVDNTIKVLDDAYLFIVPQGKEKIVKVGFEGGVNVRGTDGKDWTKNFEAMQQAGCVVLHNNNFSIYKNTTL